MNDPVYKLKFDMYPELVASTNKSKQLNNYAVWSILKVIDAHKSGSGRFQLQSIHRVICSTLHCNPNYAYSIFNKGVGKFWSKPNSEKTVYIFSLEKVVNNFPFDLAKTFPFKIKVNDLWKLETPGEVRLFLNSLVIGRYGPVKPVSKQSLMDNLGVSLSTVKRVIANSDTLTIKKNYCCIKTYKNLSYANKYLEKIRLLDPENKLLYKIIKDNESYAVIKQMPNSYSVDDYSRAKMSKRPKAFRSIDANNKDTFEKKKYNTRGQGFVKSKTEGNEYFLWQNTQNEYLSIEPFESGKNKTRIRDESKFWLMKKNEQE
jgi:hypothetical protein